MKVAGPGERTHNERAFRIRARRGDRRDVPTDCISRSVARTLDCGPSQESHTFRIPLGWTYSVDRDIIGIAIAVTTVALYFPEFEDCVTLLAAQQQFIKRLLILHGLASPYQNEDFK
jgi:hypothetical protein